MDIQKLSGAGNGTCCFDHWGVGVEAGGLLGRGTGGRNGGKQGEDGGRQEKGGGGWRGVGEGREWLVWRYENDCKAMEAPMEGSN